MVSLSTTEGMQMDTYYVVITDHDKAHGGIVQHGPHYTRKEAQWYGEREVDAAKELGFKAEVTFKIVKQRQRL